MMRKTRAMSVIGLLLGVTAAHGASITNRDERDHAVTVIEGEATANHVLKPSQTLSDVCLKGCTIRLDSVDDGEYRLFGGDAVSIEEGTVFYDTPDASIAPAPPPPGKRPPRKG
jgi:hypothetical protein